jgi:hypothetical protein
MGNASLGEKILKKSQSAIPEPVRNRFEIW